MSVIANASAIAKVALTVCVSVGLGSLWQSAGGILRFQRGHTFLTTSMQLNKN